METIWFNGLSGSGKTTIGEGLIYFYDLYKIKAFLLDGDVLRDGLNKDLGFSIEEREENLRRAAEVAKILNENGIMVIATFITPTNKMRDIISEIIPNVKFVHLDTSLETCERRDVKGLYERARAGKIKDFTGIGSVFEDMPNPWLKIDTNEVTIGQAVSMILNQQNL